MSTLVDNPQAFVTTIMQILKEKQHHAVIAQMDVRDDLPVSQFTDAALHHSTAQTAQTQDPGRVSGVLLSDPSLCSRTLSAACGSNLCGGYLHLQSQCCIGFTFFCLICFALVPTRGSRRLATETQLRLTAIPVHCASTAIARVSATTAGYLLLVCRNRHRIHLAQSQSKMHD